MPLTGESIIPEGLLLMGLQAVEKIIELHIVFTLIVDRFPRDAQVIRQIGCGWESWFIEPILQISCAFPTNFFC